MAGEWSGQGRGRVASACDADVAEAGGELLDGGSLYWVFKGLVLAASGLSGWMRWIGGDGIKRCGIVMDPIVYRTETVPKRPFQGWRYLNGSDAPRDLSLERANEDLPPKLMAALADIGVR